MNGYKSSENQYIEEINFNADDMNDLCSELNSDQLEKVKIGD